MYSVRDISSMRYVALRQREKEFISYRNETKWSYIEFAKQIYRTSEASISPKYTASSMNVKAKKDKSSLEGLSFLLCRKLLFLSCNFRNKKKVNLNPLMIEGQGS